MYIHTVAHTHTHTHTRAHTHRVRGQRTRVAPCTLRPGFHKLDYAYEASARDERASGSPKGDRAFKTTLFALFLPSLSASLRLFPSRFSSSSFLRLLRHPPHTILFLSRRQDTETDGRTDGRESRSPLSVPRAPTWPISSRHSSHVSNVQVKHRVSIGWPRYHRYRYAACNFVTASYFLAACFRVSWNFFGSISRT